MLRVRVRVRECRSCSLSYVFTGSFKMSRITITPVKCCVAAYAKNRKNIYAIRIFFMMTRIYALNVRTYWVRTYKST